MIYVDPVTFHCHVSQNESGNLIPYSSEKCNEFFSGKCEEFIEGHRCVPFEHSWTRADGEVFTGEMIAPWKEYAELDAAQREYEREQMADMENALAILLGGDAV